MPRYIDAEELKATVKANDWSNPCVPNVVNMIIDRSPSADVVEVVRCKDCDVPHNKWTGCPNLNGMIPPPDFYCAKGKRKQQDAAAANPDAQRAAMHMESMINSYNALKKMLERLPDELREKIVDRACEAISKMEEGLRDE